MCINADVPTVDFCPNLLSLKLLGDIPRLVHLSIANFLRFYDQKHWPDQLQQIAVEIPALSLFPSSAFLDFPLFKAIRTLEAPLVGHQYQYRQSVGDYFTFIIAHLRQVSARV